jgi:hypothetical protein
MDDKKVANDCDKRDPLAVGGKGGVGRKFSFPNYAYLGPTAGISQYLGQRKRSREALASMVIRDAGAPWLKWMEVTRSGDPYRRSLGYGGLTRAC